jgi:hypothetical protein
MRKVPVILLWLQILESGSAGNVEASIISQSMWIPQHGALTLPVWHLK